MRRQLVRMLVCISFRIASRPWAVACIDNCSLLECSKKVHTQEEKSRKQIG